MIRFYNMGKLKQGLSTNLHLYGYPLPTGHSPCHLYFFLDVEAQGTLPFIHLCSYIACSCDGNILPCIHGLVNYRKMKDV